MWGLGDSLDSGWYGACGAARDWAALPLQAFRVPDEDEQAARINAFMAASPCVDLARVGDCAQGTVPTLNGGSDTITRGTWREVLDELGAPAGGGPPG